MLGNESVDITAACSLLNVGLSLEVRAATYFNLECWLFLIYLPAFVVNSLPPPPKKTQWIFSRKNPTG